LGRHGRVEQKRGPMSLELSRLGEIGLAWTRHLGAFGLGEFGRAWVSAGAFQLSPFSFLYSSFALSSPFFPRILKLRQIWE